MALYLPALEMVRSVPHDTHVALMMRHSARFPILSEEDVFSAELTPEGILQAEQFGKALAAFRQPGCLFSSPVGRCMNTAKAIARGAGWDLTVAADYRLSHPFIERVWAGLPVQWKLDPLPDAVKAILEMVLDRESSSQSLDLFITHDTVVAVLAGYFFGLVFQYPAYWPGYLEGVLIWRGPDGVHLKWREMETVLESWPVAETGQLKLGL